MPVSVQEYRDRRDVPTHLPAHSPRDQPDSPEQELGRIVKSEHVVVVLHVILIEQGVQLLELQDQTGVCGAQNQLRSHLCERRY